MRDLAVVPQPLEYFEIETKYKVDADTLMEFKKLAEKLPHLEKFTYVQGSDLYFTRGESDFLRYRKADYAVDNRAELTVKMKTNEKNNIIRKEVNLRVDLNSFETVKEFAEMIGYSYEFKIWKTAHIYKFPDATLVCYTVADDQEKLHHFLEIEVDEEGHFTEPQSWDIIKRYEELLSPLGMSPQKRLKKSLFEMFRKRS